MSQNKQLEQAINKMSDSFEQVARFQNTRLLAENEKQQLYKQQIEQIGKQMSTIEAKQQSNDESYASDDEYETPPRRQQQQSDDGSEIAEQDDQAELSDFPEIDVYPIQPIYGAKGYEQYIQNEIVHQPSKKTKPISEEQPKAKKIIPSKPKPQKPTNHSELVKKQRVTIEVKEQFKHQQEQKENIQCKEQHRMDHIGTKLQQKLLQMSNEGRQLNLPNSLHESVCKWLRTKGQAIDRTIEERSISASKSSSGKTVS